MSFTMLASDYGGGYLNDPGDQTRGKGVALVHLIMRQPGNFSP